MITRPMEIRRVRSTSKMEARMVVVRSTITSSDMAGGMVARNCGSRARTRSTVSIMFAPGCRKTMTRTAGRPVREP